MSIALTMRMKALEAKVLELEKKLAELSSPAKPVEKERGLCPKCGVAPNYFFHVKNCRGLKEQKHDGLGSSGTT